MRRMHKTISLLAAGVIAIGSTLGVYAGPATYDPSTLPVAEDGVTVTAKIYPGDSIYGAQVYIGDKDTPAEASDFLDDGTPCWTNRTGTVYTAAADSYEAPSGETETVTDENGNPVVDENGNPVTRDVTYTYTDYILNPYGGTVEVVNGTSAAADGDETKKDTSYSFSSDAVTYTYTDAQGAAQSVSSDSINSAVYQNDVQVTISYSVPEDQTQVFQSWTVWTAGDDNTLSAASEETLSKLGINSDSLNTGDLTITVEGLDSRVIFIPVFTQQTEEAPAAPEEGADGGSAEGGDISSGDQAADGGEVQADGDAAADAEADNGGEAGEENSDIVVIGDENDEDFNVSDELPAEDSSDSGSTSQENGQAQTSDVYTAVYTFNINYFDAALQANTTQYLTYPGVSLPVYISTADSDSSGNVFSGWTADNSDVVFGDSNSATTTMSLADGTEVTESKTINVTANYSQPDQETADVTTDSSDEGQDALTAAEYHTLTVQNATITDAPEVDVNDDGSESASVEDGEVVTIEADEAPEGQEFSSWDITAYNDNGEEEDTPVVTSDVTQPTLEVTVTGASVSAEPVFVAAEAPEASTEQTSVPETQAAENTVIEAAAVSYTLTVSTNDAQGGSVTIGNDNAQNNTVSLDETTGSVQVTAVPYSGYSFSGWTLSSADTGASLSPDSSANPVTFTMGSGDVTLTAQFTQITHTLAITNGTASDGSTGITLAEGASTTVTAADLAGYRFTSWSVTQGTGTVADTSSASTTFTMGTDDSAIAANYIPVYTLTVTKGSAAGTSFAEGEATTVTADAPDKGYRFKSWEVTGSGSVANASSASTTFTMGAANATVTATYEPIKYTLKVTNGSGDGEYTVGELVDIEPDFPASGKEFDSWTTTKGSVSFDDAGEYYATVTMKAQDATVEAVYKDGPSPDSNQITGLDNGGEYLKGTTLTFAAVGAGMDNSYPNPGDYRYRPTGYQIGGVSGTWSSSPYQTSMAINAAGDYTLTVTYAKDLFDGSTWNADGTTVTRSITFHVVNNLSVQTGDTTPLVPLIALACAAAAVIIILAVVLSRRKRH